MSTELGTLVAVDLGASSGRVIAGRISHGRLRVHETGRFPNVPVETTAGGRPRIYWDVLRLWAGVQEGLRTAAREHGPIRVIGIDTWGVDYGLLDEAGELLGNPVHYRDERTAGVPGSFAHHLDQAAHYAATGTQVQTFNTVYQLLAAARSPHLPAAARLLLIPDLLGYWLTGVGVCELTNASTTGLLDPVTRSWSPAVLTALREAGGADVARLLAPIVEPGRTIAEVLPSVGARVETGGTRLVSVGSHDTASAVAAVPMGEAPAAYISSGTWSLVGVELDAPILTEAARRSNFTNELGVDGTVRFLRNVPGLWLLQESMRTWARQGRRQDLTRLLAAARDVPALRTVVDIDDAAFAAPGDIPARIRERARLTGQPVPGDEAQVARCILDSLALAYRRVVRQAADLSGRGIEIIHVVGGGSRNELLCRLTADATGRPVVAGPAEGAAVGNLLTQALATHAITGGLDAVRQVVRASTALVRFDPSGSDRAWHRAEQRLNG